VESVALIDRHAGGAGLEEPIGGYSSFAPRVTEAVSEEKAGNIHVPSVVHPVGLGSSRLRWIRKSLREHLDALALKMITLIDDRVPNEDYVPHHMPPE